MSQPIILASRTLRRVAPAASLFSPAVGVVLGAVLCLASASSWARPPWLCSLSDEATRLVCVVDLEPATEPGEPDDMARPGKALPAATTTPATTTRVINGTAFPLDTAHVYTVDLFAPATEREWVEQLARATICYRSPGCEVIVTGMDAAAAMTPPLRSGTASARLARPGG